MNVVEWFGYLLVKCSVFAFESIREDKLAMLKPIVNEFPNSEERQVELKEKIAEVWLLLIPVYI